MKKLCKVMFSLALALLFFLQTGNTAYAADGTIKNGVYVGDVNLAGMTADQAKFEVENFVERLKSVEITLLAGGDTPVKVKAGDFGLTWANPEVIEEAEELGTKGNVIQRYKALKDLENENKVYPIELALDVQAVNDILIDKCSVYDVKPVELSLVRENGEFQILGGQTGFELDVETSIDIVSDYLTSAWNYKPANIKLDVAVANPKATEEDFAQIKDVLGTFTTSYKTSGKNRSANVQSGCAHINGTLLLPGEEFSAYKTVAPFTEANGYYPAGSYMNGKVVDSMGGGICQVSTTLYNAVLLAELEVTERNNHSMIVSYVDASADAAIAESAGKDFRFKNNTDYPIYIEGTTNNKMITFTIYGKETRDTENRKVKYESEILEKKVPEADTIYPDPGQPIGYIVSESAHIGYKARLWKVEYESGKEVSRTEVNSSTYKMSPRSATVGTATANPADYEEIMAAIGTGSVDHVKNVIALITSRAAANSVEIGEQ